MSRPNTIVVKYYLNSIFNGFYTKTSRETIQYINSLITKSAGKDEVGGILGVSAGFYSAANAVTPLFFGSLFQWFGAPVPFLLGGLLLAVLWIIAIRTVKN